MGERDEEEDMCEARPSTCSTRTTTGSYCGGAAGGAHLARAQARVFWASKRRGGR
ncbi:hypothetical protein Cni_G21680 [Canna indica]|uniref:Uncharacterized protein n=1 Tax=Canna indica TaxID=4628 RepID=A0AAQ3KVD8_9LILI|nr:hypothetical protein Cni_G21680 [Canna indica]